MRHIPVDTLIWITLLVIGVVSSIISNARKAVKAAGKVQARRVATAAPPPSTPRTLMQQWAPQVVEVPAAPVAPVAPVAVPRPRPVAKQQPVSEPPREAAHGTGAFRGMFGREDLVRAVIAYEVLGPPKAFGEQSIWSPRHSEPSI